MQKPKDVVIRLMRQSNPAVIPRNHQVEAVITAAVNGDFDRFTMLGAVTRPFESMLTTWPRQNRMRWCRQPFVAPNPSARFATIRQMKNNALSTDLTRHLFKRQAKV